MLFKYIARSLKLGEIWIIIEELKNYWLIMFQQNNHNVKTKYNMFL